MVTLPAKRKEKQEQR